MEQRHTGSAVRALLACTEKRWHSLETGLLSLVKLLLVVPFKIGALDHRYGVLALSLIVIENFQSDG